MAQRPVVVAFNVIETLFSLASLRPRLEAVGVPAHRLETWFGSLLRDAFALAATGVYQPFQDVAAATLAPLLHGAGADPCHVDHVLAGFAELDAQPDAEPAMRAFEEAGVRMVALTNGTASATERLLQRAGLRERVDRIVTVAEVGHRKPRREVYLHCAAAAGVEPHALALVAAHA